ncbi:hypothetical protein V8C43DRAFT_310521 [Trichoderma afarasin]
MSSIFDTAIFFKRLRIMEMYAFRDHNELKLRLISSVVFLPLGIWMLYAAVSSDHPNELTDLMDFTFTAILFMLSAVHLCGGVGPSLLFTLIKRPIPQRGDEDRPGEPHIPSGRLFLNIFLIIRFCAWMEYFKAKDEPVNVGFCIACILVVGVCLPIACILRVRSELSAQKQNEIPMEVSSV